MTPTQRKSEEHLEEVRTHGHSGSPVSGNGDRSDHHVPDKKASNPSSPESGMV